MGDFLTSFLNRLSAEVFCGAHFLQYSGLAVGVWTYLWEKAGSGTKCEWSIMMGVCTEMMLFHDGCSRLVIFDRLADKKTSTR